MHQRSLRTSEQSRSPLGWGQFVLIALLALGLLLLSGQALAHAEAQGVDSQPGVALEAVATTLSAVAALGEDGPHCQHGHGEHLATPGLLRTERQDSEWDGNIASIPVFTIPPDEVGALGLPCVVPPQADVPLYLLTKRLRP